MNNLFLSQALLAVKNPNILVNLVSQRARQLGQGHKALVEIDSRMSYLDVALKEIAEGKIHYEDTPVESPADMGKKKTKKKK